MQKRPLIIVEWDDTLADSSWQDESDSPSWMPMRCVSVGWQLKSNRKCLALCSTRDMDGKCTDKMVIPRGCVVKTRRLE